MSDIRIDPETGDLDLTGSKLNLTDDDTDALAQSLTIRLKFFRGEWEFNPEEGIDYYGQVYVKGQSTDIIDSIFRERILSTYGVKSLKDYSSSYDTATRKGSIRFTVERDDGVTLTTELDNLTI